MIHATSRWFMPSPKRHRRYHLPLKVEIKSKVIERVYNIIASAPGTSIIYIYWIKFSPSHRFVRITLFCSTINIYSGIVHSAWTSISITAYSFYICFKQRSQIFRSGIILFIFRHNTFRLLFGFDRLVIRRSSYQRYSCKTYCCNYCNHHQFFHFSFEFKYCSYSLNGVSDYSASTSCNRKHTHTKKRGTFCSLSL